MTEGLTGWDAWFKALFEAAPHTYTNWLLAGAQFEGFESPELASRNPRTDLLVRTRLHDDEVLLHVEFQSASDPTMPHRLLEYNVLAEKKYKISVYSCVIYTEKAHEQACSPYIKTLPNGILVYEFRFGSINLQDLNTKELIQRKQSGLLPLLPLTRQGHDLDAIDRMITRLNEEKDTELLALALAMASICLEEDANATAWLQRTSMSSPKNPS